MRVREFAQMWPSMAIGVLAGLVLVPMTDLSVTALREWHDRRNPVIVVTSASVIERTEDSITIALVGEKKRECWYVGVSAFSFLPNLPQRDAYIMRIDMPASGATRPLGLQDMGTWRIWPTTGARRIETWITHQCEGRLVRSLMAGIDLEGDIK